MSEGSVMCDVRFRGLRFVQDPQWQSADNSHHSLRQYQLHSVIGTMTHSIAEQQNIAARQNA